MFQEILTGVLSSLVASVVFAVIASALSWKFRKQCRIALNKLFDTGILYIYQNQQEAEPDIRESFCRSPVVKIMTLRGKSFLSDMGKLRFLIEELASWQTLQFMMADPEPGGIPNYVRIRAQELLGIDGQESEDFLEEVKQDCRVLSRKASMFPIEPRVHNSPAAFRLLIFKDDIYILFYSSRERAVNNQVYRCPSSSELYEAYVRYFELVFGHANTLTVEEGQ